jgi:tetratricopeptide (TPR) repeat protein
MRKMIQKHSIKNHQAKLKYSRIIVLSGIVLFLVAVIIYMPALKNGFVNWDDDTYIYENININALHMRSLYWMATTFHASNWHPLTWLSHAVDYCIFALDPWGHHLVSIILHAFNTLLVFILVLLLSIRNRSGSDKSFAARDHLMPPLIMGVGAALLFGIHPVRVESVVWLSERKDLLCAYYMLLTVITYLFHTWSTNSKRKKHWRLFSLILFIFSLMAKPMAVSLPFVLLLLDLYPLQRFVKNSAEKMTIVREKIPYIILSLVSGVITIIAQYAGGAVASIEDYPFTLRLLNAFRSIIFYIVQMVWPAQLVPLYPYQQESSWMTLQQYACVAIVVVITVICYDRFRKGHPLLLVAWATYLIMLLPVLGIIQVGLQAAADRYTYLPSISIFFVSAGALAWLYERIGISRKRFVLKGVVLISCSAFMVMIGRLTVQQIAVWKSSYSLWSYVNKIYPDRIFFVNYNLGLAYYARGMYDKAIAEYERVIKTKPDFLEAYNNLGNAYFAMYQDDKAVSAYERVVASNPKHAKAHNNLGFAYYTKGMYAQAMVEINKALAINHDYVTAHYNAGLIYHAQGMYVRAVSAYEKAVTLKPHFAEAHYNLATAYYANTNYELARKHLEKASALGYKVDRKVMESIMKTVHH